ncbi:hypothetical protein DERP_012863 [Dermatophagoides pteronyssinus]|uniref:Uncharacterized protein n=1 Tax=Dermatophagoides pteronyssinus TaxID=6956 RepID=A0ABQ8J1K0_DERPT|nr:hypothetical protein DERP_012863 [Dermatophagoides pteronyssinus]
MVNVISVIRPELHRIGSPILGGLVKQEYYAGEQINNGITDSNHYYYQYYSCLMDAFTQEKII